MVTRASGCEKMVEITIYVEGVMSTDASVLTIDNSALLQILIILRFETKWLDTASPR